MTIDEGLEDARPLIPNAVRAIEREVRDMGVEIRKLRAERDELRAKVERYEEEMRDAQIENMGEDR